MEIKSRLTRAKIKMVVLVSAVMWILVFSQIMIDVMCEKKVSIKEAFAIGDEISVKKYSNEIVSKLKDVSAEDIAKEIMEYNVCSDYTVSKEASVLRVMGKVEKYIITVTISEVNDKKDMYLHYTICNEDGTYNSYVPDECYIKSENVMQMLEQKRAKSIRYTRFDGVIKGSMSEEKCKKYTQKIFERIDAKIISEHFDTEYTAYGHSDNFENEVNSGRDKINMQVRYNYNEITGNTEIVVATPIIMD